VWRLNANGTPDATFGTAGAFTATLGSTHVLGQALALLPDGRIIVGGALFDGTTKRAFVARITATGALEGYQTFAAGNGNGVRAIARQTDGKLVLAGDAFISPTGNDFGIFRLE
jgi:uncharacterized delta-60 repeat protein